MPKMGFKSDGNQNAYVYLESADGGSACVGFSSSDNNRLHISPSTTTGESPSTSSPMMVLDPRTGAGLGQGDIVLLPKGSAGSGSVVIQSGTISQPGASAGVLTVDTSAQGYYRSSNGTNGQVLIGGGTAPAWANLTAGSGVTITNAANAVTIAVTSGGTVVETITGNTGGAISPSAGNINIVTAHANIGFAGSGSTETIDFIGDGSGNLVLGSTLSALAGGTLNTGFGATALSATTSATENTAFGNAALFKATSSSFNSGFGLSALQNVVAGNGHNTSVGAGSGASLASGAYNALFGFQAGNNYTTGESSNIILNSAGTTAESNVLRIGASTGTGNQQLSTAYICGIDGVNVGSVAKVVTMASGSTNQLGTATITAGTNISVTAGANTITIAGTGAAGFTWNDITGTSATMAANNGYVADNAGLVTLTLPGTAAFGSVIEVTGGTSGLNTGSWKIAQPAGVTIHFGTSNTTTGVGGSLQATKQYDSIRLVCIVANTDWVVSPAPQGNITVV